MTLTGCALLQLHKYAVLLVCVKAHVAYRAKAKEVLPHRLCRHLAYTFLAHTQKGVVLVALVVTVFIKTVP